MAGLSVEILDNDGFGTSVLPSEVPNLRMQNRGYTVLSLETQLSRDGKVASHDASRVRYFKTPERNFAFCSVPEHDVVVVPPRPCKELPTPSRFLLDRLLRG
jgi:hypothetical protein